MTRGYWCTAKQMNKRSNESASYAKLDLRDVVADGIVCDGAPLLFLMKCGRFKEGCLLYQQSCAQLGNAICALIAEIVAVFCANTCKVLRTKFAASKMRSSCVAGS